MRSIKIGPYYSFCREAQNNTIPEEDDDEFICGRLEHISEKVYPIDVQKTSLIELLESATAKCANDLLRHMEMAWKMVKQRSTDD